MYNHTLYKFSTVSFFSNFQVPSHFIPVVEVALREFFNSIHAGKDQESSWKKQIYKIIQRYDEPIPENFKTLEFLKSLEWVIWKLGRSTYQNLFCT